MEIGLGGKVQKGRNCTKIWDFGIPSISRRTNHWIVFEKIALQPENLHSNTDECEPGVLDLWPLENDDDMTFKKQKMNVGVYETWHLWKSYDVSRSAILDFMHAENSKWDLETINRS